MEIKRENKDLRRKVRECEAKSTVVSETLDTVKVAQAKWEKRAEKKGEFQIQSNSKGKRKGKV